MKKKELVEIKAKIDLDQQLREKEKLLQLAALRKRQAEEAKNPKKVVEPDQKVKQVQRVK